ncbi:MAG: hypothetical protein JXR03_08940 [Cyclobacteriaceae bacterium]
MQILIGCIRYSFVVLIFLFCFGCNKTPKIDFEHARKEILELHNLQRKHHFDKDSVGFASKMSEEFVSVNRGIISTPSKSDNIKKYNRYFSSVEFLKWDDVEEPVIRFSDDGSLAYTIVNKIVSAEYDENGTLIQDSTSFAWVTIYRKYDTGWKIDCVASTNK